MAQSSPIRDDFSSGTSQSSTANDLSKAASDIASSAGKQVERGMESAQQMARDMAERGSDATGRMQEVAGNIGEAVQKSVKDQPTATLLMAAAVGFVLGALWKS